jgi:hypothetical protein
MRAVVLRTFDHRSCFSAEHANLGTSQIDRKCIKSSTVSTVLRKGVTDAHTGFLWREKCSIAFR